MIIIYVLRETELVTKAVFCDLCLVPEQGRNVWQWRMDVGWTRGRRKIHTVLEQHWHAWLLLLKHCVL